MKKALIYALALALALSLTACGQPKTEQPTDPTPSTSAPETIATPEPIKDTIPEIAPEQTPAAPVETEDTQPPEETESEEVESQVEQVQLFTDCNETVYATGTVNIRASYTADSEKLGSLNKGDSVTRTGIAIAGTEAEGWSRIQLSDGSTVYVSNKYISTTKPAPQQQQQQTSKPSGGGSTQSQQQQQQQQPQQPSEPQGGGGDSAADIEARKQAFLNGMNQMFEDHGYTTGGSDHEYTEEEKQALLNALGQ
ncbi:SH3 domain-containing protein [Colidextribacter sp. OB.20]|uniref:SH3 domain-containing protein n=1 Tax=Colidextribacter sp. OB.20 TaxID=2304568 RepID=UPI001368818B|nr:SH3 domain-containing protein [Colidextribacter sp. OB.20]NBI11316.1 SH3 domain-containing protein [Colidextribacter sp. OB.20]